MSLIRRAVGSRARSLRRRVLARSGGDWWRGTDWERVRDAGVFQEDWYRTVHRAALRDGVDPLWHYATRGAVAGLEPNPLFDPRWYLDTYPDVAAQGMHPLVQRNFDEGIDCVLWLALLGDLKLFDGGGNGRRFTNSAKVGPGALNVAVAQK